MRKPKFSQYLGVQPLSGFCLSLVAYNLYAVVMAALRATHLEADVDSTVSEYFLAAAG